MVRTYLPAALLAACLSCSAPAQAAGPCSAYAADLAVMASADQALRHRIDFADIDNPAQKKLASHLRLVDHSNTARLKAWIARCGWPSRDEHGEKAAGDAWLLAQHADHDLAFQKQALALVERDAARSGKGVDQLFALLSDRVAVAEKRPQRYGTQLAYRSRDRCDLDFHPMDDRQQVEARRAQLKLPPLEEYKQIVKDMQHCPGSSGQYHYAPPAKADVR